MPIISGGGGGGGLGNVTLTGTPASGFVPQATGATTAVWQYPALTTVDTTLAANVALTSGAYTDGASASFAAGTWLVVYKCTCQLSGTSEEEYTARLWDGTTVYDESQNDATAATGTAGDVVEVSGSAVVTLGSTTTLKVSVRADHASQTLLRDVPNGSASSHTATRLSGLRIA